MEIFSKIKHISIMAIKRVLIYLVLSVLGWSMCFDQINSIRNEVYGIGNYLNIKACSGMLMILNGIFLAFLVLFLFQTRKLLYKSGNRSSENFKDYVKFETILEISVTLGYVLLTAVISFFVKDNCITAGLIVPIYCIYYLTHNIIVAIVATSVVYLILIFVFLALPYIKLKRRIQEDQKR